MAKKPDAAPEGEYAFPMPAFDEKAFMRREVEGAKISFWAGGGGVLAGVLAWALDVFGGDWRLGWLPILISMALMGPALKKLKFSDEQTTPKAMFGNWFLVFFTALSVWIVLVNVF